MSLFPKSNLPNPVHPFKNTNIVISSKLSHQIYCFLTYIQLYSKNKKGLLGGRVENLTCFLLRYANPLKRIISQLKASHFKQVVSLVCHAYLEGMLAGQNLQALKQQGYSTQVHALLLFSNHYCENTHGICFKECPPPQQLTGSAKLWGSLMPGRIYVIKQCRNLPSTVIRSL